MTRKLEKLSHAFKHQAAAVLDQAAPVQNTWYTVLDTTLNCRINNIAALINDTGETVAIRITIDGQTISNSAAYVADTRYYVKKSIGLAVTSESILVNEATEPGHAFLFEGRSVKVEARKTTANGAGNLKVVVSYAKIP